MSPVTGSGVVGRRFATSVALTTVALGVFGAALAVAAVVRAHFPVLDWSGRVRLVLRWTAIGALAGLGVGVAAGVLSGFVARRWVRWILVGLLLVLTLSSPERVSQYPALVDWPTIAALLGLLIVTKGIEVSGALHALAHRVLGGVAAAQQVVEGVDLDAGPQGPVGQDQIQLLAHQDAEKVLDHPVLATDELQRVADVKRRL